MNNKPLTLAEATGLCDEYRDLVGQPFCGEYRNLGTIKAIAVAPYGKLDKFYFLQQYDLYKDAGEALGFYAGTEFDVVIIGNDAAGLPACRELTAHLAYVSSHPDMLVDLD